MYGKPTIANSNSITDGIRQAAYEGMRQALSENGGNNTNVTFEVQGDADNIFKIVQKGANNYTMQTGKTPFLI